MPSVWIGVGSGGHGAAASFFEDQHIPRLEAQTVGRTFVLAPEERWITIADVVVRIDTAPY
ncbi:hypothetical protein D3C86_2002990 [compost metagenome]